MRWPWGVRLPRELRTLRHLLSVVGGYFWLPCPCCGADFAGYEAGHRHVDQEPYPGGGWISACVCRWCDTCPGAEREQADLAELVGAEVVEWCAEAGGTLAVWRRGATPAEWRCGS